MRIQTFKELTDPYNQPNCGFDSDDIIQRSVLSNRYPYSVVVEGSYLELQNLEKWNTENINETPLNQIWYGKLGYDFGCVEYFFNSEENAILFTSAVPKIYTSYPNSFPEGLICKSEGYEKDILYNSGDTSAIVFR